MPIAIFVAAVVIYAAAAAQDLRERRVSNYFCLGIAVLGIARWAALMQVSPATWAVVAALVIFGVGFAFFYLGLLAGGDVKLISATPLLVGGDGTPAFIMWMSVIGGVLALLILIYAALRWVLLGQGRVSEPSRDISETKPSELAEPATTSPAMVTPTRRFEVPSVPYGVAVAMAASFVLVQIQRM